MYTISASGETADLKTDLLLALVLLNTYLWNKNVIHSPEMMIRSFHFLTVILLFPTTSFRCL